MCPGLHCLHSSWCRESPMGWPQTLLRGKVSWRLFCLMFFFINLRCLETWFILNSYMIKNSVQVLTTKIWKKSVRHKTAPVLFGIYFITFIVKRWIISMPRVLADLFSRIRGTQGIILWSFPCFFFSFPQCTFTSYAPSSNRAFDSELPENICGFHAAPGAPGIQLSEVCSLHWDRLETA